MEGHAVDAVGLGVTKAVLGRVAKELGGGVQLSHLIELRRGHGGLEGHVEAAHGDGHAALEDGAGRLRVAEDVGLRRGAGVAPGGGAAHDDDLLEELAEGPVLAEGQGDVGQGPYGHQHQLALRRFGRLIEGVPGGFFLHGGVGGGQRHVAEAVLAVDEGSRPGLPEQGPGRALIYGHVLAAEEGHQVSGVLKGLVKLHVPGHRRDALHVVLRDGEQQGHGHGVVHAGVRVEPDGDTLLDAVSISHRSSPPPQAGPRRPPGRCP